MTRNGLRRVLPGHDIGYALRAPHGAHEGLMGFVVIFGRIAGR